MHFGRGVLMWFAHAHILTSWHGNIFSIIAPLWGESTNDQCIPHAKCSYFDVFFIVNLNMLYKQLIHQWFETT